MTVAMVGEDPRFFRAVFEALERDATPALRFDTLDDLLCAGVAALGRIEVLYAPGYVRIDDAVFARLPSLHGLVSPYTGIEGFDRAAASARGILIGNGQIDENVDSMAEATVMLLLAAAYKLPDATAAMADGAWPRPAARGRLLKAMTVGIVGYGRIAQGVVGRLAPFGCALLIHAPRLHSPLPPGAEQVSLETLAERSDAVVVLAALGPDTHHLIGRDLIARMKPDAIVVNTARGGLIDEAALVEAGREDRLGGLALDVFEMEPLPPDNPVRMLSNAILTPHTIGHTRETIARLPIHALENIRSLLRGEPPLSLVNVEALPAWQARSLGQGGKPT